MKGLNGNERKIEQITRLLSLNAFDAKETEWDLRPTVRARFQQLARVRIATS